MKIIQLIQKPQLRGAEIFTSQLADCLLIEGHDVLVVSLFLGRSVIPFSGEVIHLNRPEEKRFWDWFGWKQFDQLIKKFKPDIVQANAGDTLKFAVLSKFVFRWNVPVVFRNASTISLYIKSPLVKWFNQFLFYKVARVISVSQSTKRDFLSTFSFNKDCIDIIPVGLTLKESESFISESKYLLHVGGFSFEKNHKGILKIFKRLLEYESSYQLWLVGDGPLREEIEKDVVKMGMQSHILLLGYKTDVIPLMKSSSALLLPSLIEGLPGVVLEAMYCKTPVIAYDVGGISEVVKNEETGWLVKSGDEEGFVEAVIDVLKGGHESIIENAYNMVVSNFDNRDIAKRFLKVYEKLISNF